MRFAALSGAWILAGGLMLVAFGLPATLHAQSGAGAREVHLVRQPGNEEEPFAFSPAELIVPAGTTVRWVNDADVFHTVTFAGSVAVRLPSGIFEQTLAMAGQTVEFRFDEPGMYAYYCEPHVDFMAGIVRVTAGDDRGQLVSRLPAAGTGGPSASTADSSAREATAIITIAALVVVLAAALHWRAHAGS